MQLRRQKYLTKAVSVFLFSILLQIIFLALLRGAHKENESADYVEFYAPVAENLLQGRGLVTSNGAPAAEYPPGFPLYLAAHFYIADHMRIARSTLIKTTNVLLMALSAVALLWISESIFTGRIALISALLWASYPFSLWLAKQPNGEIPFMVLLYLLVWLFLRSSDERTFFPTFVVLGLLLGVAAMIRPIALFLPLVFSALLLVRRGILFRRRLCYAGLTLMSFVLAIAPWEAELKSRTGHLVPLSTNGPASMLDGLTFSTKVGKGGDRTWVPAKVELLAERVRANESSLHTSGDVVTFLVRQTRNDPVPTIQMGMVKALRSWYGTDAMWHEPSTASIQSVYLLLALLGVCRGWRVFAAKRLLMFSLLLIVFYFWAMTIVVLSILRYMVPAMGILLIFAAVSLDAVLSHWTLKHRAGKSIVVKNSA